MNKSINIYYSNHGKLDGIEDFLTILKTVFVKRGYTVKLSDSLDKNDINLIIDEFTNVICNEEIAQFKRLHPKSKLYYILTEFIEEKLFVKSFNFFGGSLDAAPLAAMNIFFRLKRHDFNSPKLYDWLIAIFYFPLMLVYIALHQTKKVLQKKNIKLSESLYSLAYMKMRYLGLERMIEFADGVILSHSMIEYGLFKINPHVQIIGTIHPEIDNRDYGAYREKLFKDKILNLEITGSITPFRQAYLDKINSYIIFSGLKHVFHLCKARSFADKDTDNKRAAYSLHPPQTRNWKYASPTRIYRAIVLDQNIPVLTKKFNQHPIEELCLEFVDSRSLVDMYHYYNNPRKFFAFFEPRLFQYMKVSKNENDKIISAISK